MSDRQRHGHRRARHRDAGDFLIPAIEEIAAFDEQLELLSKTLSDAGVEQDVVESARGARASAVLEPGRNTEFPGQRNRRRGYTAYF